MISLDIAKNCGVAVMHKGILKVFVAKGTSFYQASKIFALFEHGVERTVIAEDLFKFRNAKTTRSLLRRAGSLEALLALARTKIQYRHHGKARAYIGAKDKDSCQRIMSKLAGFKMTFDEADAAVLLMCELNLPLDGSLKIKRVNVRTLKCSSYSKVAQELEKLLSLKN